MSTIRASDTGISRKTERFCQLLVCHRCRRSRAWELTLALITIKPTKLDLLEAGMPSSQRSAPLPKLM